MFNFWVRCFNLIVQKYNFIYEKSKLLIIYLAKKTVKNTSRWRFFSVFTVSVIEQTFVTPLDCHWNLWLRKWQLWSCCFAQFWHVHLLQDNRTNFHCGSPRRSYRLKKYRMMLTFLPSVIEKSPTHSCLSFITQNRLRVKNYYRNHIIKKNNGQLDPTTNVPRSDKRKRFHWDWQVNRSR